MDLDVKRSGWYEALQTWDDCYGHSNEAEYTTFLSAPISGSKFIPSQPSWVFVGYSGNIWKSDFLTSVARINFQHLYDKAYSRDKMGDNICFSGYQHNIPEVSKAVKKFIADLPNFLNQNPEIASILKELVIRLRAVSVINQLSKYDKSFIDEFGSFDLSNRTFLDTLQFSLKAIQYLLKKILDFLNLRILKNLSHEFIFRFIGKGIEGFITYVTWARPPTNREQINLLLPFPLKGHPGQSFSMVTNHG